MSGVGSTNAMKKGSANNPFLAFSEADMSGYLNSAYTGCIVKYSGEAINREVSDINKTVGEYAQNIVFNLQKDGRLGMTAPQAIKIDIINNGSSTTQYIYDAYVKDNKAYPTEITGSVPMLVLAASMDAGADVIAILCDGSGVWQKSAVNDQGKVTLWAYSEDVLFTVVPSAAGSIDIFKQFFTIVPYIVGELYKVVYGNGQYYYEEFYYISEERTTGNSDYIAPGKTMYDFTGSLQTGNGSKVNPYIANTVDEMSSYLTTAYRGAFIKYVGTSTSDYTNNAVYQVLDDGDTTRYAILPALENEGTASDLASGKQLINSQGEVVVGEAATEGDIVAKFMQRQLTEFVTSDYISAIGFSNYSNKDVYMTFKNQSMLTKFDCQNIGKIWAGAFDNCSRLSYLKLAEDVDIEGMYYDGARWYRAFTFPTQFSVQIYPGHIYADLGTSSNKYANLSSMYQYSSVLSITPERLLPGAVYNNSSVRTINWSTVKYASPFAIQSCTNLSQLTLSNLTSVPRYFVSSCAKLSEIDITNCKFISDYAFDGVTSLEKIICPNVEFVGTDAFRGTSKLLEPYDFPKCKEFLGPYSTVVNISSVNLPVATNVQWRGGCFSIESVNMPNVQSLYFTTGKIQSLSLPVCEKLAVYNAQTLQSLYAPALKMLQGMTSCGIQELDLPELISANTSYNISIPYLSIYYCSSLKNISLPKFAGYISASNVFALETVNCPSLLQLSIWRASALKSIYCPAVISMEIEGLIASDITITSNNSELRNCRLALSNSNDASYAVDINILNVSMSYNSAYVSLHGNAINSLYFALPINFNNINNIRNWYFSEVKSVSFSSNVQAMPSYMFSGNSYFKDIDLYNISAVGSGAFSGCINLSTIYMPKVQRISAYAFTLATKLEYAILLSTPVYFLASAFYNTPMSSSSYLGHFGSIYVPASLVSIYKATTSWAYYSSRITSITDLPQELKDKYNLNGVE